MLLYYSFDMINKNKFCSYGTLQLRWNACYAVSNMFKNTLLNFGGAPWTVNLHCFRGDFVNNCH